MVARAEGDRERGSHGYSGTLADAPPADEAPGLPPCPYAAANRCSSNQLSLPGARVAAPPQPRPLSARRPALLASLPPGASVAAPRQPPPPPPPRLRAGVDAAVTAHVAKGPPAWLAALSGRGDAHAQGGSAAGVKRGRDGLDGVLSRRPSWHWPKQKVRPSAAGCAAANDRA